MLLSQAAHLLQDEIKLSGCMRIFALMMCWPHGYLLLASMR